MKTSDPYAEAYAKAARVTERCQYHTPTGRQCACLIQDPQSKVCPRHSVSSSTDTQNFADLLAESAEDFQTPEGINHSLAHLFRLLAGGHISTRRATGLGYIASLLLRTLPAIKDQLAGDEPTEFEIQVLPRQRFPRPGPEEPGPEEPEPNEPGAGDSQDLAPREHVPQQPPPQSIVMASLAIAGPPPVASSPSLAGPPSPESSPHSFSCLSAWAGFRRTPSRILRTWKPRFDAAAPGAVHCAYASVVQLAPLQL